MMAIVGIELYAMCFEVSYIKLTKI